MMDYLMVTEMKMVNWKLTRSHSLKESSIPKLMEKVSCLVTKTVK